MKPRILVIRGGALGDFVLTLPAIRLLREAFPGAHLEILGYQHIIALASERYYADATRSIEYGPMAGFFVPGSELAADLTEYFSGFQQVISYLFDPDGFFEGNLRRAGVKNLISAYAKIDDSDHAARQLARPLESLALFLESAAAEIFPDAADRAAAAEFLGPPGEGPIALIAIHPSSGSPRKNWPLQRWRELSERLIEHSPSCQLLVISGEADTAETAALVESLPTKIKVAANLPLPTLAAILERCTAFLGHDSGVSHVAAAVGTPCLLLFGPTDPSVWAPANPLVATMEAPGNDFAQLTVAAVFDRFLTLSGNESPRWKAADAEDIP